MLQLIRNWTLPMLVGLLVLFAALWFQDQPRPRRIQPDPLGLVCPEGFSPFKGRCVSWPEGSQWVEGEP